MEKLTIKNGYQEYPQYEKSSVDWLGNIPAGWKVRKVKHLFKISKEKSYEENPTILSLTLKGIKVRDISGNDGQLADSYLGYNKTRINDIVLNPMDLISGFVDCAKTEGVISPAYTTLRSIKPVVHDYYKYYFQWHYHDQILFPFGEGVSVEHRWTLKNEDLLNFPILEPDKESQERIYKFLDDKTKRLEAIVNKKYKLIKLLNEKQLNTINEVITGRKIIIKEKGKFIVRTRMVAELKDSKNLALGMIPKDWTVIKLKYLGRDGFKYGANEAGSENDISQPRFIRITDIDKDGNLKNDTFKSLEASIAKDYMLEEGDILFARSGATAGKTFKYQNSWGKCCYAGYLIKLSINKNKALVDYIYNITRSRYYEDWKNSIFIQATIQNISAEKYKVLDIPLPSKNEQLLINEYLDYYFSSLISVISKELYSIDAINRYKLSLIFRAITGKIIVKNNATKY